MLGREIVSGDGLRVLATTRRARLPSQCFLWQVWLILNFKSFSGRFPNCHECHVTCSSKCVGEPDWSFSGKSKGSETGELKSYLTQVFSLFAFSILDLVADQNFWIHVLKVSLSLLKTLTSRSWPKWITCLPDPTGDWRSPGREGFLPRACTPGVRWFRFNVF